MKNKAIMVILTVLTLISSPLYSTSYLRVRPFQLSLGYPLGTNGLSALDYVNNMSLNLIYGINGGLDGVEIGATFNYLHHYAKGVQISGAANIVRGTSDGVFITGAANLNLMDMKGIGISGGLNLTGGNADGLYIAGGANLHLKTFDGVDIAGGLNMALEDAEGFTIAPVNIFFKDYFGVQIGVVNIVNTMDGLQLGVVNIVKNGDEALPIGLVSFVKNGYFDIEFKCSELSYLNADFKMGVPKFYNIYSMGYSYFNGAPVFRYGLGFGTSRPVRYRQRIAFELAQEHVIYDWNLNNSMNYLTTLRMDYRIRIGDSFTIVGGPSLNAFYTDQLSDGQSTVMRVPKTFYEYAWYDSKLFAWVGWNLGFSYLL